MAVQKIAVLGANAPDTAAMILANLPPATPEADIPEPVIDEAQAKEIESRLLSNLAEQAPGGEYNTIPSKSMIRNYMLQRNVNIQNALNKELSTDDLTMVRVAKKIEDWINVQLLSDKPHTFLQQLGDFVSIVRSPHGFYELEVYQILNNPHNPLPTTKLLRKFNVNRLSMMAPDQNPLMEVIKNADGVNAFSPIIDLDELIPVSGKATGVLQNITLSVYNVMQSMRSKRWTIVTLCPDASEVKSYKPIQISHPLAPMGLNALLGHCLKNQLTTRDRKSYQEYLEKANTTA